MDEKAHDRKSGIPVPATAQTSSPTRRITVKRALAMMLAGFAVHTLLRTSLNMTSQVHTKKRHPLVGKAAEKVFLSVPNAAQSMQTSRLLASKPHPAGSPGDLKTALDWLHLVQTELGIEAPADDPIFPAGSPESQKATLDIPTTHSPQAWIDKYYPVMNTPLDRAVQVIDADGNVVWDADLTEHTDDTDPEAGKYYDSVPTFHGLSKGGDVTGKLVYANYGRKDDYDALVAEGVNMTGTIILARYGEVFRGLKVKGAQEVGAVGIIIYSDIRDDGDITEANGYKPYPYGPARSPTSVQRGSVQFLSMYPGDPTTPGWASHENVTRTEGLNIPSIPSLPISSENGKKLLELTASGATVRLLNNVDTKVMPIWNTMAVIPGYITDEVLVVGNHRDAWVMGAMDPIAGASTLSETIRGFGVLMRKGWKPLRTIVIASWDAEEYGLIGSTEWGEDFEAFIDKHVVAYYNLDGGGGGSTWSMKGSPLLAHFIKQTALDIRHPTDKGRSLWDARSDTGPFLKLEQKTVVEVESVDARPDIGVLGSGSDFTVFLQRLGVASADGGFGAGKGDAVYHYHSVYDSEHWMEMYGDPGFHRHVAVAQHLGLQILRLTSSVVLPFNTTHYAYEIERYLEIVESLEAIKTRTVTVDLKPLRESIHTLQAVSRALDYEKYVAEKELLAVVAKWKKAGSKLDKAKRKLRKAYCKIQEKLGRPCEDDFGGASRFGDKAGRVGRFAAWQEEQGVDGRESYSMETLYGIALEAGLDRPMRGCGSGAPRVPKLPVFELGKAVKRVRAVNRKLVSFERGFISEGGIPEREWYKHLGVAPGKWLGYGATTLPALTEAITIEGNATLAAYEADRLKGVVDGLVEAMRV